MNKYLFAARHYGMYNASDRLQVLAMQLLGPSISSLRRKQPDSFLPFGACVHILLQMLPSVEALHREGYIHRDLKPSNFVHGNGRLGKHQIYIIDFGQSRMYVDDDGALRPPRPSADFRGTSLYSSLNAHLLRDLGRRDDMWALWYIFIELARGGLPGTCCKEERLRCEIAKTVRSTAAVRAALSCSVPDPASECAWHTVLLCRSPSTMLPSYVSFTIAPSSLFVQYYMAHPEELVAGLPGQKHLLQLHAAVAALSFEDTPDYALFSNCLRAALADAAATGCLLQRNYAPYAEVCADCATLRVRARLP